MNNKNDHYDKKNKKILLIDDEPDIIYSIKRVLEDNEFVVDSYTDPTLALANVKPRARRNPITSIKENSIDWASFYIMHVSSRNEYHCYF